MTTFTVTITDKPSLVGIAMARKAYNAGLPTTTDKSGAVIPNPGVLASDADYVQMIMTNAALSYADTFNTSVADIDSQISDLQAQKAALAAIA